MGHVFVLVLIPNILRFYEYIYAVKINVFVVHKMKLS